MKNSDLISLIDDLVVKAISGVAPSENEMLDYVDIWSKKGIIGGNVNEYNDFLRCFHEKYGTCFITVHSVNEFKLITDALYEKYGVDYSDRFEEVSEYSKKFNKFKNEKINELIICFDFWFLRHLEPDTFGSHLIKRIRVEDIEPDSKKYILKSFLEFVHDSQGNEGMIDILLDQINEEKNKRA